MVKIKKYNEIDKINENIEYPQEIKIDKMVIVHDIGDYDEGTFLKIITVDGKIYKKSIKEVGFEDD